MIIPAILEQSMSEVQKKIDWVKDVVDRVQIDVIDDHQTVTLRDLRRVNFYRLAVDIHLMTTAPEKFLSLCFTIAKDVTSVRVIGQIERMRDQQQFIQKTHDFGLESGLALDLYTPISSLDIMAREEAHCILLMSVKAGFAGQHFDDRVIEKIKEAKKGPAFLKKAGPLQIVIDGGLNPETVSMCYQAGATEFAVGSYLWHHEDIHKAFLLLQNADQQRI